MGRSAWREDQAHWLRHLSTREPDAVAGAARHRTRRPHSRQPGRSTLRLAGVLADNSQTKLDTSAILPNLLAAYQLDNKTYGIPIGANTLALYYNKNVLTAAGVDPTQVKDWASLNAALAKIKAAGKKGITISAIGTEEGSFQFLPWFWGSGANLTKLDSTQAVAAFSLWASWLKNGYAPNAAIQDTQTTAWQEFATGDYGFAENGTWQLGNADKAGFPYGIIPIPGMNGGLAPAPTGGEFVEVPIQKDTSRYAVTEKIVACLSSADNALHDRHCTELHRRHEGRSGQAGGQPRTACLGAGGQRRKRPDERQPRHQLPEDFRADVDGGAEQPHGCEVAARCCYRCTSSGRGRNERQMNGTND